MSNLTCRLAVWNGLTPNYHFLGGTLKFLCGVLILSAVLLTACGSGSSPAAGSSADGREIPNVVGLTLTEAVASINKAGLSYEFHLDGKQQRVMGEDFEAYRVGSTEPHAGEHLTLGTQLKINSVINPSYTAPPVVTHAPSTSQPVAPSPSPTGLTYSLSCTINSAGRVEITNYKSAWSQPFDLCTVSTVRGTPSPAEKAAAAYEDGSDPDSAKYLYALCATTAGHYFSGAVSGVQAKEIAGALTLCPEHPKRAQLEANAAAGQSLESDRANGKLVYTGSYLVGKDVQPGTWQSQGEKVENCYWEISDAQGNIIDNNFISVAPQFSIHIPPTAAGFTVRDCGFRWIGN